MQDIHSNDMQKLCILCKNCAKIVQKNVVVSWTHNNAIDINDIGREYNHRGHRGTQRIDLKTLCSLWLNPVAFTACVGSIQPQQNCAKNKK
ncbi:MAG: hypothetical protein MOIL_01475 [Candidatus Methanolliviera sp. GoM_oil]|nr:MAG: hypothetical protein MOIL_01475 [Candidatus Methanolliviera sp. GoM_oil]